MKKILYSAILLSSTFAMAQQGLVGINTEAPKTTLHITDFGADNNSVIEIPRKEAGLKIPTQTSLPAVPFETSADKTLSKEKNGMLIHLDRPASDPKGELQGFFFWDDNAYSWQNIIDTREVNLDTSKIIAVSNQLTKNIVDASTEQLVITEFKSFDEDFSYTTNEIIIGKPASYYLLIIGSVEKGGSSNASTITLSVIKNSTETVVEGSTSFAANQNGELRTANIYISKIVKFEKNDKISFNVTGGGNITSGYVKSPFSITLIKLD